MPHHDDRALFELLILEGARLGSVGTALNKRERYRKVFDGFDAKKVARYGERKRRRRTRGSCANRLKVNCAQCEGVPRGAEGVQRSTLTLEFVQGRGEQNRWIDRHSGEHEQSDAMRRI